MTDRIGMTIHIDAMTMLSASVDDDKKQVWVGTIIPCKYVDDAWGRYDNEKDRQAIEEVRQLLSYPADIIAGAQSAIEQVLALAEKGAERHLKEEEDPLCDNCPQCGHYDPEAENKRIQEVEDKVADVVMDRMAEDYKYFKDKFAELGVPFGEMRFDCMVDRKGGKRWK